MSTIVLVHATLQGYEINGRQLCVDFAENDNNTDKGRDQVSFRIIGMSCFIILILLEYLLLTSRA
jgi:hypothetical protein